MRRLYNLAVLLCAGLLAILVPAPALSSSDETLGPYNVDAGNVMLKGYDPVAYFPPISMPTPGAADLTAEHDGVIYRFADPENRDRFLAAPERYVPAYGGYCAYGVSVGQKLDIDPAAFRVIERRLYVYLDLGTRLVWAMDEPENLETADKIWPRLRESQAIAE